MNLIEVCYCICEWKTVNALSKLAFIIKKLDRGGATA